MMPLTVIKNAGKEAGFKNKVLNSNLNKSSLRRFNRLLQHYLMSMDPHTTSLYKPDSWTPVCIKFHSREGKFQRQKL